MMFKLPSVRNGVRFADMATPYKSGRTEVIVVALMIACSVMSYFDRTIMSIAGPQIMKEFDLSATQMGSVYSAFILSYALMMIPGGPRSGPVGSPAHAPADEFVSWHCSRA